MPKPILLSRAEKHIEVFGSEQTETFPVSSIECVTVLCLWPKIKREGQNNFPGHFHTMFTIL